MWDILGNKFQEEPYKVIRGLLKPPLFFLGTTNTYCIIQNLLTIFSLNIYCDYLDQVYYGANLISTFINIERIFTLFTNQ